MALQTSGAISLNDIHVEAGGTTGTAVSINDADVRGLISASAGSEMDFTDWYGASAATVEIDNGSLSDVQLGGLASAEFRLNTNGTITTTGNLTSYSDTNWYEPTTTGIGSSYQVQVTASGDTSSLTGTLNSYQTISSARSWTLETSSIQQSVTLSVSVRDVATSTVQDTATITMTVESGL